MFVLARSLAPGMPWLLGQGGGVVQVPIGGVSTGPVSRPWTSGVIYVSAFLCPFFVHVATPAQAVCRAVLVLDNTPSAAAVLSDMSPGCSGPRSTDSRVNRPASLAEPSPSSDPLPAGNGRSRPELVCLPTVAVAPHGRGPTPRQCPPFLPVPKKEGRRVGRNFASRRFMAQYFLPGHAPISAAISRGTRGDWMESGGS